MFTSLLGTTVLSLEIIYTLTNYSYVSTHTPTRVCITKKSTVGSRFIMGLCSRIFGRKSNRKTSTI